VTGTALARRRRTRRIAAAILVALLVVVFLASLAIGQFTIGPDKLWSALVRDPAVELESNVLWQIRTPRTVLAVLVGAALAVSGALLQGLFGNPLAEPSVIGVTSGAGVGAAVGIVFGLGFAGTATIPLLAFAAGTVTTVLVYCLAAVGGEVKVVTLILIGIAVNAVAGAATSFLVYLAPTTSRDQIIFWQMGSLNGAQWGQVATIAVPILVSLAVSIAISGKLDLLSLGERAAGHAGVDVRTLRIFIIGLSTALAAAAVAFAGVIGFVGLIVPHILRQVVGSGNRWLVPLSALGGGVLVMGADIAARTLIPFSDLPIGIFTAVVGGPTFFLLLRRTLLKAGRV